MSLKTVAMPINFQSQSRFCTITPEIRNRIYDFVFAVQPEADGTVALWKLKRKFYDGPYVQLLQTCRFIYNEAAGIFYNTIDLSIGGTDAEIIADLKHLASLQTIQLSGIKSLTIQVYYTLSGLLPIGPVFQYASPLPKLQTLSFELDPRFEKHFSEGEKQIAEREMMVVKRWCPSMTSLKLLRFNCKRELDTAREDDRLLKEYFDAFVAKMPYAKAAKALEEAAKVEDELFGHGGLEGER